MDLIVVSAGLRAAIENEHATWHQEWAGPGQGRRGVAPAIGACKNEVCVAYVAALEPVYAGSPADTREWFEVQLGPNVERRYGRLESNDADGTVRWVSTPAALRQRALRRSIAVGEEA